MYSTLYVCKYSMLDALWLTTVFQWFKFILTAKLYNAIEVINLLVSKELLWITVQIIEIISKILYEINTFLFSLVIWIPLF